MDFAAARRNMVDCQILPNRVADERIIDAMLDLPRERFMPAELAPIAYVDEALPLGNGRFVMEPMVLARMLETLELKSDDVAMSIGCSGGYSVALLARIVSTVVAVECDKAAVQRAGGVLTDLGIDNVAIVEGELSEGKADQAPFDVIVFNGAVDEVPPKICDQLAEGGRLIAIVRGLGNMGTARLMTRFGGTLSTRDVFDAGTPPLPGFSAETEFVF